MAGPQPANEDDAREMASVSEAARGHGHDQHGTLYHGRVSLSRDLAMVIARV